MIRRLASAIAVPKSTAWPSATQRQHYKAPRNLQLFTPLVIYTQTCSTPHRNDHFSADSDDLARTYHGHSPWPPSHASCLVTFAPSHSRFYCKTPHFARHLTFNRIVSTFCGKTQHFRRVYLTSLAFLFSMTSCLFHFASNWHRISLTSLLLDIASLCFHFQLTPHLFGFISNCDQLTSHLSGFTSNWYHISLTSPLIDIASLWLHFWLTPLLIDFTSPWLRFQLSLLYCP